MPLVVASRYRLLQLCRVILFQGWLRLALQQRDKIQECLKKATRLDPVGGETLAGSGEISFLSWNFDKAKEYCDEALANDSNNMYAGIIRSLVTGFKGDWQDAIKNIESIYQKAPYFNLAIVYLGYAHAKAGNIEKAREFIMVLEEKQKQPHQPPLYHLLSILHLAIGDFEKFYENYEAAVKMKSIVSMLYYNSPILGEASKDERVRKLRAESGFPL